MPIRKPENSLVFPLTTKTKIVSWDDWYEYLECWHHDAHQARCAYFKHKMSYDTFVRIEAESRELGIVLFNAAVKLHKIAPRADLITFSVELLSLLCGKYGHKDVTQYLETWNTLFSSFNSQAVFSQSMTLNSDTSVTTILTIRAHVCTQGSDLIRLLRKSRLYVSGWQLSYKYGDLIKRPDPFIAIVAYDGETPVGVMLFTFDGQIAGSMSCQLFVRKAYRGKGIVSKMSQILAQHVFPAITYVYFGDGIDGSRHVFRAVRQRLINQGKHSHWELD